MANTLASILNDAGNRALVEKYLSTSLLERRDWGGVMANTMYFDDRGIPTESGQYVQFTRLGRFRRPQTMDRSTASNEVADPKSGAKFSTELVTVPVEYIQEYIDISKVSQLTSWVNLERWAKEDLPMALKRRMHELAQNAPIVGRFKPGQWSSVSDVADTAFDATKEATVSMDGVSFTFKEAPKYYAAGRASFAEMEAGDRITWADVRRIALKIKLAGGGNVVMFASSSVINDLMHDGADGEFFSYAIRNSDVAKEALRDNKVVKYAGVTIVEDDQPYTEDPGAENVRATDGAIHSVVFTSTAPKAIGYINLGGKKTNFKPSFKVQDISKTGVQITIGYMVPYQVAVLNPNWCAVLKTYVSEYTPNNA